MRSPDAIQSVDGHRLFATVTALNRRTTAAYARCDGQHRPSGEYVSRDFGSNQHLLPICARCSVPYGGPRRFSSWTIK